MRGFDPYTYRPMMRYFYNGGPLPQAVAAQAKRDPVSAPYMNSTFQFTQWLKQAYPQVHSALASRAPQALDPVATVASGSLTPGAGSSSLRTPSGAHGKMLSGLGGLGDLVDQSPVTDWGKTITDTAQTLMQLVGQHEIIKTNVQRAEQGLPPIEAGALAPQVNVGVSSDVKTLAFVGIGALLVGALFFAKGRR